MRRPLSAYLLHAGTYRQASLPTLAALLASLCCSSSAAETVCTRVDAIVGGSSETSYLELNPDEARAIVGFTFSLDGTPSRDSCSGVVVGPGNVLTAAHCLHELTPLAVTAAFDQGEAESGKPSPGVVVAIHSTLDLLLVQFDPRTTAGLVPLAIASRDLQPGDLVQLVGMGEDENGSAGERRFAVENVIDADGEMITVRGEGNSGACAGDSGGPLLVRDGNGQVAVAGILSRGSASCTGTDHYTRLSSVTAWLEPYVAGASPEQGCGAISSKGRCFNDVAIWCEHGSLAATDCGSQGCGWAEAAAGWRCIDPADDPCSGVDDLGTCAGDLVVRCADGEVTQVACNACNATCRRSTTSGAAGCQASPESPER